jgi:hypothetical protein
MTKTSAAGTTMLRLKQAASEMGFQAVGRHGSFDLLLRHVRSPNAYALLHSADAGSGHFVGVVEGSDAGIIRVVDVLAGIHDFDEQGFLAAYEWDGNMLLLWTDGAIRSEAR